MAWRQVLACPPITLLYTSFGAALKPACSWQTLLVAIIDVTGAFHLTVMTFLMTSPGWASDPLCTCYVCRFGYIRCKHNLCHLMHIYTKCCCTVESTCLILPSCTFQSVMTGQSGRVEKQLRWGWSWAFYRLKKRTKSAINTNAVEPLTRSQGRDAGLEFLPTSPPSSNPCLCHLTGGAYPPRLFV